MSALLAGDLEHAATCLGGLGPGLTPSGDDFLAGAMLRAHLCRDDAAAWCRRLVRAAAPLTTTYAAALLQAAARGEATAAWQMFLADPTPATLRAVLARGATSGADMVAGFLTPNE